MANITGTNNKDILHGTAGVDKIYGQGGDDIIYGYEGDDTLGGGAGNDIIYGGDGNDIIYGGAGDDKIIGGAGADTIYGGDGIDTVSYEDYVSKNGYDGVYIYLDNSDDTSHHDNDAAGDTFFKVENVIGSQYGDTIYGDSGDNIIWGNGGNDMLYGYSYGEHGQPQDIADLFAGNDIFYTGSRTGDRVNVYLGLGHNTVYGGDGDEHIDRVHFSLDDYIAYGQSLGKVTLYLGEGNNDARFSAMGEYEITAGSGDDYVSFTGPDFFHYDISYLTGEIIIDVGGGDNRVEVSANILPVDIVTGNGMDYINVDGSWGHGLNDIDVAYGDIKINAGGGTNYISVFDVNYIAVNIKSGDGKDKISINESIRNFDEYGNHHDLAKEYYADERILDSGGGDDEIEIRDVNYFDINSGSENDEIIASGSHLTIDAGTGDDYVEVGYLSDSFIDLGAGNDEIVIGYNNQNIAIKGGAGDDVYNISLWNEIVTIDNYDEDGGRDILQIDSYMDNLSARMQGNDLLIFSQNESQITLQNFALSSDYQIDLFNVGHVEYSAEQFLAEMGLTL